MTISSGTIFTIGRNTYKVISLLSDDKYHVQKLRKDGTPRRDGTFIGKTIKDNI